MKRRFRNISTLQRAAGVMVCVILLAPVRDASAQIDPPRLWAPVLLPNIPAPGVGMLHNSAAAWADVDGDGDLDLFYAGLSKTPGSEGPYGQLYENQGDYTVVLPDNTEVPATDYEPLLNGAFLTVGLEFGTYRGAVAWGDYDGDGKIDLATTGLTSGGSCRTRLFRNRVGDGLSRVLQLRQEFEGTIDGDLAWGDLNNDGRLDLIFSGQDCSGNNVLRIFINVDNNSTIPILVKSPAGDQIEPLRNSKLALGDYDNDMDLDVLVTGVTGTGRFVTSLYRNDGDGALVDVGADLPGLLNGSVAWGDGDGDGDLDILLTGGEIGPFLLDGRIFVLANNGGTFSSSGTSLMGLFGAKGTGRFAGDAEWADFNSDGLLDFFVNGFETPLSIEGGRIYQSQGGMHFVYSLIGFSNGIFTGGGYGRTFWGDYDGDGHLDLFASGRDVKGTQLVRVFRKDPGIYLPSNGRPQPPGFLNANVQGNVVMLSWAPAYDDRTPAPALTYNVRIGTAPGSGDVMPAMSRNYDGVRSITAMGNAGHNLGWKLIDLAPGTYYWTVQTIDTGFRGSEFSVEETFTVPAQ